MARPRAEKKECKLDKQTGMSSEHCLVPPTVGMTALLTDTERAAQKVHHSEEYLESRLVHLLGMWMVRQSASPMADPTALLTAAYSECQMVLLTVFQMVLQ